MSKTRFRLALEASFEADTAQDAVAQFEDRLTHPPFIREGEDASQFDVRMLIKQDAVRV